MTMTKQELDALFKETILPSIQKQEAKYKDHNNVTKDIPMRCEEYNNLMDYLCRDNQLTADQVAKYSIPNKWI